MSALLLLLKSNPLTTLLGISALALVVALGVQTFRIEGYKADVAKANQSAAEARTMAENVARTYAENDAANQRALLESQQRNEHELSDLQAKANTLQATLNQKDTDYKRVSAQLRDNITNAPRTDSRPIGPTMRTYFDSLRQQQSSWHDNDQAPPGGD